MRKIVFFLHICNFLIFDQKIESLIFIYLVCNMFLYSVLVEVYKENLALHKYIARGGKSLIAFSDNGGYSSLLAHQNSARDCF